MSKRVAKIQFTCSACLVLFILTLTVSKPCRGDIVTNEMLSELVAEAVESENSLFHRYGLVPPLEKGLWSNNFSIKNESFPSKHYVSIYFDPERDFKKVKFRVTSTTDPKKPVWISSCFANIYKTNWHVRTSEWDHRLYLYGCTLQDESGNPINKEGFNGSLTHVLDAISDGRSGPYFSDDDVEPYIAASIFFKVRRKKQTPCCVVKAFNALKFEDSSWNISEIELDKMLTQSLYKAFHGLGGNETQLFNVSEKVEYLHMDVSPYVILNYPKQNAVHIFGKISFDFSELKSNATYSAKVRFDIDVERLPRNLDAPRPLTGVSFKEFSVFDSNGNSVKSLGPVDFKKLSFFVPMDAILDIQNL